MLRLMYLILLFWSLSMWGLASSMTKNAPIEIWLPTNGMFLCTTVVGLYALIKGRKF